MIVTSQTRNSQTKEELTTLYDQLQTLEDEQHELFRHISELRRIGNEYPPRIREAGLSPPNEHTSCLAVDVATENAMAADSLLAELDRSYQLQEREQPTEARSQRSVQVSAKSVAANLKITKCKRKQNCIYYSQLILILDFPLSAQSMASVFRTRTASNLTTPVDTVGHRSARTSTKFTTTIP